MTLLTAYLHDDGALRKAVETYEVTMAARARRRSAMRLNGYAASAAGLTVVSVRSKGIASRHYPASTVVSAKVADVAGSRVTIDVETIHGTVELPWVPRSRDVLDAVAGWTCRRE